MKAIRQHVQQETAHEFAGGERHGLDWCPAFGTIVLPAERNTTFIERDEPLVGNGHPVGIARQIGQHGRRADKRPFGIHHPFALAQRRQPVGEGARLRHWQVLAEELQTPGAMSLFERLEEAPAEQAREHTHGQKEAVPAGYPAFAIEGEPATRNDAMHVGMVRQCRTLGVQDQRDTDLRAQMLGIGGDGAQRLGGDIE